MLRAKAQTGHQSFGAPAEHPLAYAPIKAKENPQVDDSKRALGQGDEGGGRGEGAEGGRENEEKDLEREGRREREEPEREQKEHKEKKEEEGTEEVDK